MSKLRLDVDQIQVESFAPVGRPGDRSGTVFGKDDSYETNYASCTCVDDMCSANCTGLGVECYTADPVYADCTGGHPCTGGVRCTRITTCAPDTSEC